MNIITVSADGQIKIPNEICHQLGIPLGGQVYLEIHDRTLLLTPIIDDIRLAFGLLKAKKSVSLEDMDIAIEQAVIENDES